jgi:N-dimethylarginine dimethylaminohydrolase
MPELSDTAAYGGPGRSPRTAPLPQPEAPAAERSTALNVVTLGPRRILMAAGFPTFREAFAKAGLECLTVAIGELRKAASAA